MPEKNDHQSRREVIQKSAIVCGSIVGLSSIQGSVAAEPVEISECTTITEPGEYALTNDISSDISSDESCISIDVVESDVIIDGNGYSVSGDGTGTGISAFTESATIRDLTIKDFAKGVDASESGIELKNTLITENTECGIEIAFTNIDIRDSAVTNNEGDGINPWMSDDIRIVNSTLSGNSGSAYVGESIGLEMINCTVTDNDDGVIFTSFSNIEDNEITDNNGVGLRVGYGITGSAENVGGTIIGNEIQNNTGPGIEFISTGANVKQNTITGNEHGVYIPETYDPIGGKIIRNNIEANDKYGVRSQSSIKIEATCNYWGHKTGPQHKNNPRDNPKGEKITGNLEFTPWSVREVRDGEATCIGGRPISDFQSQPTDPDGDDLYEDLNGDGESDIVDVQALFSNLDDETIQNNPDAFDFNGDGSVNVVDVQKLFNEVLK